MTYAAGALYVEMDSGDILACDPTRCATTVRTLVHETALALSYPLNGHALAADERAVYWAAVDKTADAAPAYRIMKLAK